MSSRDGKQFNLHFSATVRRWFRSLFAWRDVPCRGLSGVWLYSENTVTGERKALRIGSCWQPIDLHWLEAGNGYRIYDQDRYRRVRAQ